MTLNELFVKLFGSNASNDEFEHLNHWQKEGIDNAKSLQGMLEINVETEGLKDYQSFDVESALLKSMNAIEDEESSAPKTKRRTVLWLLGAVSLLALSLLFYVNKTTQSDVLYANEAGTINIENGSAITLNEESSYSYNSKDNQLNLDGEAFFDVAKQKQAFSITTKHGLITVLGTSFNVKTSAESTSIYMYEGKVKFEHEGENYFLIAGQYLSIDKEVEVSKMANEQVISYWRTKVLNYKIVSLTNVLEDINRLYNSKLSVVNGNPDEILITSSFENNNLEEIVQILQSISGVSIK